MCWIESGTNLMGRLGSGVWVSTSFQKNACLVGQLGSGSRLVVERADVVPANKVNWPTGPM